MFPIAAGTGTRSARPPTPVRRSCCLCQHLVHHVTFDVCCAGVQGLSKINTCCCTLWCPKAAWAPLWWYLTSPKTPTVARRTSKSTPRPSAAKPSKFNYAMTTKATVRLCDGTDVSLIRSIHPPSLAPFSPHAAPQLRSAFQVPKTATRGTARLGRGHSVGAWVGPSRSAADCTPNVSL